MPYDWSKHESLPLSVLDKLRLDEKRDGLVAVIAFTKERFAASTLMDFEGETISVLQRSLDQLERLIEIRNARRREADDARFACTLVSAIKQTAGTTYIDADVCAARLEATEDQLKSGVFQSVLESAIHAAFKRHE